MRCARLSLIVLSMTTKLNGIEIETLRRKVVAAEAMAAALALCASLPIARGFPNGPCIDREDHKDVVAALAAWQEANKV